MISVRTYPVFNIYIYINNLGYNIPSKVTYLKFADDTEVFQRIHKVYTMI